MRTRPSHSTGTAGATAARFAPATVTDLEPVPIALRPGATLPRSAVSVTSGSVWANPFESQGADVAGRCAAVGRYAVWLAGRIDMLTAVRHELAGRDLACDCPLEVACHRDVLLDVANPPARASDAGRLIAVTVRRPWASMLLVPSEFGGPAVLSRSWATDHRGLVGILGGSRIDSAGVRHAERTGLDAQWHSDQSGWLGVAVLVDIHRARRGCCLPWGRRLRDDAAAYHWVFTGSSRLALRSHGRGFLGLRPVSWSQLLLRNAFRTTGNAR